MDAETLRRIQAPLKDAYRADPASARATLRAEGSLDPDRLACRVESPLGPIEAGLHPMTGGDGSWACSADMLLQALVACAGVTLAAVARAMGIELVGGRVVAEGDLDFRGTLGVSKEAPVGFADLRLRFEVQPAASVDEATLATLLRLAERYCVVYQSLKSPPTASATIASTVGGGA